MDYCLTRSLSLSLFLPYSRESEKATKKRNREKERGDGKKE